MARFNPAQFIQQTRAEAAKVVWPSGRETRLTTIMVLVLATIAAIFFFLVDSIASNLIELLLSIRL